MAGSLGGFKFTCHKWAGKRQLEAGLSSARMGPPGDSSTDSVFLVFNLNLIKSCYGTGNAAHDGRATVAVNGEGPGPQATSAHGLKAELGVLRGQLPSDHRASGEALAPTTASGSNPTAPVDTRDASLLPRLKSN